MFGDPAVQEPFTYTRECKSTGVIVVRHASLYLLLPRPGSPNGLKIIQAMVRTKSKELAMSSSYRAC